MREWKFQSSSSPKIYTTRVNPDTGLLSCDCLGWVTKKMGKSRQCKHTIKVANDENLTLEERDGQMFVVTSKRPDVAERNRQNTADKHPNWKGGEKESEGYTYVYNPSYHRATKNYAKRADMVLEEKLGRLLEPDEEAHHINHVRSDDSPENLEVKFRSDHRREQLKESPIINNHQDQSRDSKGKFVAGFVSPMLASRMPDGKTADSYSDGNWVLEEKFDGHRIIVRVGEGTVTAWSRLGNVRTLPKHIATRMSEMAAGVYDGELLVPGMHSYDVTAGQNSGTERLVLFDIIESLGFTVKDETQEDRRKLLEIAYGAFDSISDSPITLAQQTAPSTKTVQAVWDRGGEGAIIKNLRGKYSPGWRSPDWIKVKSVLSIVLTVTGYEAGKSGPYSIIKLMDSQGIETKVKTLDNDTLRQIEAAPASFIGRKLVVQYQEKVPSGKLRHPMFDHWASEYEKNTQLEKELEK